MPLPVDVVAAPPPQGKTFYVSSVGDDTRSGNSETEAFATLAKAVATANADPAAEAVIVLDDLVQTAPVELTGGYLLRGPDTSSRSTTIEADGVVTPLVKVSHPGAVVAHLTLSGGTATKTAGGNLWLNGGGTVTNCLLRDATGKDGRGGGVRNDGGLVTHCVIEGGEFTGDGSGVGVYQTGEEAVTEHSIIRNNRKDGLAGGGGVNLLGGVVRHCVVSNNVARNGVDHSGFGGGIYMTSATVHHCLVAYNRAGTDGGGIKVDGKGNVISNCTIVCNRSRDRWPAVAIFPNDSVEIDNTIIWGNETYYQQLPVPHEYGMEGKRTWRNSLADPPVGENPVVGDPCFVDPANGDFRLSAFSPAVGTGLAGEDLGYEPLDKTRLAVGLSSLPVKPIPAGDTLFLAASCSGEGDLAYRWRIDDILSGVPGQWTDYGATTNHLFSLEPGHRRVVVEAKDSTGTTARFSRSFIVGGRTVYLVPPGTAGNNPVAPYDSKATAANDIQDAVRYCADGSELVASDGDYGVTREVYLPARAVIRSENGPEKTSIYRIGDYGKGLSTRVVHLRGDGATLSGFAVTNGYFQSGRVAQSGCNVVLYRHDVVTNCIIAFAKFPQGQYGAAAIAAMNGKIYDTVVRRNSGGGLIGGGVCLYGPETHMADCVVSNHCNGNNGSSRGCGVYAKEALIERCVVRDNLNFGYAGTSAPGGGIYLDGGEVRDSLICDNDAGKSGGGGIFASGKSRIANCTIANNYSPAGGGLKADGKAAVTVVNTIFAGNSSKASTSEFPGEPSWLNLDGPKCSVSHIAVPDASSVIGEGSIVMPFGAKFVDEATGDYSLDVSSPCRDAGTNGDRRPEERDVAGNPRIVAGTIDIGAHEFQVPETLTCNFIVSGYEDVAGEVTFVASTDGADLAGLEYRWRAYDVVKDAPFQWIYDGSSYEWTRWDPAPEMTVKLPASRYRFTLQVRNAHNVSAEKEDERVCSVVSENVRLVTPEGALGEPVYPYDSWEHAATNLPMALSAAGNGTTILATNGCYGLTSGVVLEHRISLRSVEGPRKTSIYRAYPRKSGQPSFRPVTLQAPGALLAGFTVSNSIVYGKNFEGAAIYCKEGVVSNCVASFNSLHVTAAGAAIKSVDALVVDCLVHDNTGGGTDGFGISQKGLDARTERCVIFHNSHWDGQYCHGALVVEGGVASRCVITNNANVAPEGDHTAGVFLEGGTLRDSLVASNRDTWNGGGVYARDGALVNCTIVANRSENGTGANGGAVVFSVGNEKEVGVTNCIVHGNWSAAGDGSSLGSPDASVDRRYAGRITLSHTLLGNWEEIDPDAIGCLVGDPLFKDPENGDWRLARKSPCRDAGATLGSMAGGFDLDGRARVNHKGLVDLGCYESVYVGDHTLLVIR